MERGSISDYFTFTKRERTGILTLLALIAICLAIPRIWEACLPPEMPADSSFQAEVAAFEQQLAAADTARQRNFSYARYRYRDSGQYRTARNNAYYQNNDQYSRAGASQSRYTNGPRADSFPRKPYAARPSYKIPVLDINTADSLALESLPGIGPALAGRIVRFRERLGGFYSVSQVGETFGLPDSTFKKIQPYLRMGNVSLKKLDINQMDEKSLAQHPYIRYKLARLIVRYRSIHGPFSRADGLLNIPLVDDSIYRKLEPYIQ